MKTFISELDVVYQAIAFLQIISTSPLGSLIRGLPDAMRKQYGFEAKAGQHLFYSSFLRVLTISLFQNFERAYGVVLVQLLSPKEFEMIILIGF